MNKPTINLKRLSQAVQQKLNGNGEAAADAKLVLRAAARQIGIGASTLWRIATGEHTPSVKTLVHICDWLQTSTDEFLAQQRDALNLPGLPFFGPVNAGMPAPAFNDNAEWLPLQQQVTRHPTQSFCVRANGNSMIDAGIFDRDLLVVDRAEETRHGHIVVVSINEQFLVKRLDKSKATPVFRSANPNYPDFTPKTGDEVVIWGRVVQSLREH
ncbi:MAG: hypothetical protein HYR56_26925 [Acidobacteria bacterium]|nr:hypothetical protein [Acidobacteriota bacterium]MBI3427684.1 hypothetical protein [Acidobacteriota bacterium]